MKSRLCHAILICLLLIVPEAYSQEITIPERWKIEPIRQIYPDDTLTIRIFGDLMMHTNQIDDAARTGGTYDFSTYFTHIRKYLDSSDLNVGNMEFTLAGKPYTGYPAFSAPDEYARHIARCGFDIFLTANNHICDKNSNGMSRTLKIYRELAQSDSILFTGTAGNQEEFNSTTPLIVTRKGVKLGMVNATYGTNISSEREWPKTNYLYDKNMLKAALQKAKESADIVIAFVHWGEEYKLIHNSRQESEAKWLAQNGADIIIGAHPHVVQDTGVIEVKDENAEGGIKKVPVVYSLGNAISNMSAENTQIELMATLKIVKKHNGHIQHLPIEFTYLWSSRPGGYCNHFTMLPVLEQIGKSDRWIGKWEYDKMIATYKRVKSTTKVKDSQE